MKYIIYKRFKEKAICGIDANLPRGTECYIDGNVICYNGFPLCIDKSENAHKYFTQNEDGFGLLRGKIISSILKNTTNIFPREQKKMSEQGNGYQPSKYYVKKRKGVSKLVKERWEKIWEDETCLKYKRPDRDDYFLWNHEFYNAPIADLEHIAKLINIKIQQGDK